VPETWIHQGKALYLSSIGRHYGTPPLDYAFQHAYLGEDWPSLHDIIVNHVAPKMVVEGDEEEVKLAPLNPFLHELEHYLVTPEGTKDR